MNAITPVLPQSPLTDPRPFGEVAEDWRKRHRLTQIQAAETFGVTVQGYRKWLKGGPCPAEKSHRALMTLIDERRIRPISS